MTFWDSVKEPWKKNWAETIHYLVIAISIIVTGFWVFYTFTTLFEKEKAEQSLQTTTISLEKAKAELKELHEKIAGTDSSNIELSSNIIELSSNKFGMIITVTVQNTGTNDVDMFWSESPVTVYETSFEADKLKGVKSYTPYIYGSLQDQNSENITYNKDLYLFVGAKKVLSFFVELDKEGLYYIKFESKVNKNLQEKLENKGKTGIWFSSQYVFVKKKMNKA
jgi:hypothetical protein